MKIGILTFHRAHNYGAVLQCYALQEFCSSLGHNVEVIDYRQPHIERYYSFKKNALKGISSLVHIHPGACMYYLKRALISLKRNSIFDTFRKTYLKLSKPCFVDISTDYDVFIVGSDQMWCFNCVGGKYDKFYWGEFIRKPESKLIGYVISANKDYSNYFSNEELKKRVNKFDALSFRELEICNDIYEKTGCKSIKTLDPTLIVNSNLWNPLINNKWKEKKYVAIYSLRGKMEHVVQGVYILAKSKGWSVIDLSDNSYPVADFVSIIRYAQCVFTSSFHATVFSVIFGTPFYSFKLNDGYDGRYVNLLTDLDLTSHLVDLSFPINEQTPIVPFNIEAQLHKLRAPSISFLQKQLVNV